ncbi:hypothetical protein PV11_04400 [Exophiala sideris]|uniref:Uncharacterized protein n=1 Tax=Exophiala sideris TaxID=1016849 RepID=A0A0D1YMF9_9EURO|nr:hypothetical protein PV11_04400 [Exophiala sideris]
MTDHQLRKRQERAYLCIALDKAADQFTGNKFKNISHACKATLEFYPKDVDIGQHSLEEHVWQKIQYAAKKENIKVSAFLKDWNSLKSELGIYHQFVAEQARQGDADTQPVAATGKKLKIVLGQTSTENSAPNSTQDDDEDDGESIPSTTGEESDPEDGTYTEPKIAPAESKARSTASTLQASNPHHAPPDSKARSTASTLPPTTPHITPPTEKSRLSYGDPPNHKDIARELNSVLERLDQGIRHFREVHSLVKLTATTLINNSVALSKELLKPSAEQTHQVVQNLAALFANKSITIDLVFRSYAAAAVNKWIFNDFNDFVEFPESQILSSVRQLNRGIYDQLKILERMKRLDNVKATIPQQAVDAEGKLLDILESLGVSAASVSIAMTELTATTYAQSDVEHRAQRHALWQDEVRSAFSQALNLRIKLARSPLEYLYRWPCIGYYFDHKWMQSVHDDHPQAEIEGRASVLLCLRPALYSSFNKDLVLIVPALVMLHGFGNPAAGKIPFLNGPL